MLQATVLALTAPAIFAVIALALRPLRRVADQRGIALQTVIIMVVLVVIGGAVAAVLINRSGSEVERFEDQGSSSLKAADYATEGLCEIAGHVWTSSTSSCGAQTTKSKYTNRTACEEGDGTWNGTACS